MNKVTKEKILKLAAKGYGRPRILREIPEATEWEVRIALKSVGKYTVKEKHTTEEASVSTGMKILGIDIETSPNMAYVWGLFKQTIAPVQIIDTSRVLCFAYKWFNNTTSEVKYSSEYHNGRDEMIHLVWKLLDEADAVVHYNGISFDVPALNREFLKAGLTPPSPFKQIDLLQTVRKTFRFASNKLEHVLVDLGIGKKVSHTGFDLWVKCLANDAEAWELMKTYNIGDVAETENLYNTILPWISNHPNFALYTDNTRPVCTNCGGHKLQSRGMARTKTQEYKRFQCQDCGTWVRERFTSLPASKRRNVLTQAV